jgi:predicted dehydrogenase
VDTGRGPLDSLGGHRPIVIAGLGSMGRRHCRNLVAGGWSNVVLYRTGRGILTAEEEREFSAFPVAGTLEQALARDPVAVVVCNPSSLHVPVALDAARAGCALLIEKPLGDTLEGVAELRREVRERGLSALVGYQFRFHPTLGRVHEWVQEGRIGRIVSAHGHWGEYLPSWHPWEDYRGGYSARRDLGGGAILTLSHPIDYVRWIAGEVTKVQGMASEGNILGLDVEEGALLTMATAGGAVAGVYVDYLERPPAHWLHLVGEAGVIRWDNETGAAELKPANGDVETFLPPTRFDRNAMFRAEMDHFLRCVAGEEEPACTLDDGIRALEVALAAKRSISEGCEVVV